MPLPRTAKVEHLRKLRGLPTEKPLKRDLTELETYDTVNHSETRLITDYSVESLFSGNTSCILTPEHHRPLLYRGQVDSL